MRGHMDAEASFNGPDDLDREGPLVFPEGAFCDEQVAVWTGLEVGQDMASIPAQRPCHMVGDLGVEIMHPRLHLGRWNVQQKAPSWAIRLAEMAVPI